jgi:catechol 2,3-dioxygenase-like lactoylglutathione lyase family enzyme
MFGRFLEISLATDDIAASVLFYERLGFTQLSCGDTWSHPYGVLSDGRICIGLHQRTAAGPLLSFVRPGLAQHLRSLQAAGFEPHYVRLGDSDFHELHLRDPAGQNVVLLEARTFSPGPAGLPESRCGYFSSYSLPTLDFDAEQAFWERTGFVALDIVDAPFAHLPLTSDHLNLTLHRPRTLEAPMLVFTDPRMDSHLAALRSLDLQYSDDLPRNLSREHNALLLAPEGTLLALLQTEP